ncbi:hypothetical protein PC111_g22911 [Phytophthora cactorum]|uniref:Uncharacterized protein n=2 Tax=Phytophthora cactorum TaxID=29920 RepID=A0A8T1AKE1_9STRA|nr:hypothetical protein PC111_g22911 [Phytophthora cactorum]KAG2880685.1 hypothetical protein PC115_g22442 [Phytophthora cactorum]
MVWRMQRSFGRRSKRVRSRENLQRVRGQGNGRLQLTQKRLDPEASQSIAGDTLESADTTSANLEPAGADFALYGPRLQVPNVVSYVHVQPRRQSSAENWQPHPVMVRPAPSRLRILRWLVMPTVGKSMELKPYKIHLDALDDIDEDASDAAIVDSRLPSAADEEMKDDPGAPDRPDEDESNRIEETEDPRKFARFESYAESDDGDDDE